MYVFEAEIKGEAGTGQWCSITKIEMNNNKFKIDNKIYKSKDMFNSLKSCSGNYDMDEIKSVKVSSKQLYGFLHIWLDLIMFFLIIFCVVNSFWDGVGVSMLIGLFYKIALRVKTIKITFNSNKSIHIPIKPFLGNYLSIDYREETIQFIDTIKSNIKII